MNTKMHVLKPMLLRTKGIFSPQSSNGKQESGSKTHNKIKCQSTKHNDFIEYPTRSPQVRTACVTRTRTFQKGMASTKLESEHVTESNLQMQARSSHRTNQSEVQYRYLGEISLTNQIIREPKADQFGGLGSGGLQQQYRSSKH